MGTEDILDLFRADFGIPLYYHLFGGVLIPTQVCYESYIFVIDICCFRSFRRLTVLCIVERFSKFTKAYICLHLSQEKLKSKRKEIFHIKRNNNRDICWCLFSLLKLNPPPKFLSSVRWNLEYTYLSDQYTSIFQAGWNNLRPQWNKHIHPNSN